MFKRVLSIISFVAEQVKRMKQFPGEKECCCSAAMYMVKPDFN